MLILEIVAVWFGLLALFTALMIRRPKHEYPRPPMPAVDAPAEPLRHAA